MAEPEDADHLEEAEEEEVEEREVAEREVEEPERLVEDWLPVDREDALPPEVEEPEETVVPGQRPH